VAGDGRTALVIVLHAVQQQRRHRHGCHQRNRHSDDREADVSNDQAHQFQSTYDRQVKSTATTKVTSAADKSSGAQLCKPGIGEICQ
jgi:hypothetical protein